MVLQAEYNGGIVFVALNGEDGLNNLMHASDDDPMFVQHVDEETGDFEQSQVRKGDVKFLRVADHVSL